MSVAPYNSPTAYPGAAATVTAPPSIAVAGASTVAEAGLDASLAASQIPDLSIAPWSTALPGEDLIITVNGGGNTGTFEINSIVDATTIATVQDPGNGDPTNAHCTPTGRSGLNDLALRLQNGYTDADANPHVAIPSTIIGGVILTEASPTDDEVKAY